MPGTNENTHTTTDALKRDIESSRSRGYTVDESVQEIGVRCVMMGTTARSTVWTFLRGDVLKELLRELPEPVHVVICE